MSEPPLSVRKPAAPDRALGDCFVVFGRGGLYWSGERWVRHWTEALQFSHQDAYDECDASFSARARASARKSAPSRSQGSVPSGTLFGTIWTYFFRPPRK